MTTYEALSLLAQFCIAIIGLLTLIVTLIVVMNKKK